MKRGITVVMVVAMLFALSGLVYVYAQEKQPDATLTLTEGQVAAGIGWSWGKGVLTYKGKEYPFKVKGLSVVDIGITKASASGKVFRLEKLENFNGTYSGGCRRGNNWRRSWCYKSAESEWGYTRACLEDSGR